MEKQNGYIVGSDRICGLRTSIVDNIDIITGMIKKEQAMVDKINERISKLNKSILLGYNHLNFIDEVLGGENGV